MSNIDTRAENVVGLKHDCVVEVKGSAECTIAYGCDEPEDGLQWSYLKRDAKLDIEAGRSLIVKQDDGWARLNFFEAGTITGPMVFAEDKLPNAKMLIDWKSPIAPLGFISFCFAIQSIIVFGIGVNKHGLFSATANGALAAFVLFLIPAVFSLRVLFFESDQKSASRLNKIGAKRGTSKVALTPPKIDVDSCGQPLV